MTLACHANERPNQVLAINEAKEVGRRRRSMDTTNYSAAAQYMYRKRAQ